MNAKILNSRDTTPGPAMAHSLLYMREMNTNQWYKSMHENSHNSFSHYTQNLKRNKNWCPSSYGPQDHPKVRWLRRTTHRTQHLGVLSMYEEGLLQPENKEQNQREAAHGAKPGIAGAKFPSVFLPKGITQDTLNALATRCDNTLQRCQQKQHGTRGFDWGLVNRGSCVCNVPELQTPRGKQILNTNHIPCAGEAH